MTATFVVHYSEIALKGKNRPEFTRYLRRNLRTSLLRLGPVKLTQSQSRFIVECEGDEGSAVSALQNVFGVAWFAPATILPADYPAILEEGLEIARKSNAATFMVDARRADKSFPMSSLDLARALGAEIVQATGKRVDLTTPELTVHVDVLKGRSLVYSQKTRGPGGLPVGTGGRVLHLFSGGIDSPVAAWLLMKRGCTPVYLHFYLAPTPEYAASSKVMGLVKLLASGTGRTTTILVPFAEYQLATAGVPGELEPSLFRRFMRMTAELLAPRFGAAAISTGDCLAQAASQTVWNIGAFDAGSSLPILRPLLTYDKEEVIQLARKLGTYDLSLEEYRDCCAILTRHPRTRVRKETVDEYASQLNFAELAHRTIENGTVVIFDLASGTTKMIPMKDLGSRPTSQESRTLATASQ